MKGMVTEVGATSQAGKQHQNLPDAGTTPLTVDMREGTQHGFTGILRLRGQPHLLNGWAIKAE